MVDTPHSGITHFELNGNPEVPINAAFDDLDENASGYIFKTISGDHDFTADLDSDGDSLWFRHKTVELLGTLSADAVITIPLAEQHKIVWNNTSGGFSITFEANAGSPTLSTVTVPNGAWAHLAVNSLGHVFDTLDTLSLATLTITSGLLLPDGSAAAPSLAFADDTNTGMWNPAADTLAWSTAGIQAMGIDPAQNIQITVGYVEVSEMTEPSAPGANKARIFLEDDGVSPNRLRLMVRFPSGASQQIAFEP